MSMRSEKIITLDIRRPEAHSERLSCAAILKNNKKSKSVFAITKSVFAITKSKFAITKSVFAILKWPLN